MTPATLILQALGLAGMVTLLHGLMLWEGASLRQWIIQFTRRRKPKPKSNWQQDELARRYVLIGFWTMVIASFVYTICVPDLNARFVPLLFFSGFALKMMAPIMKSNAWKRSHPRIALKNGAEYEDLARLFIIVPFVLLLSPPAQSWIAFVAVVTVLVFYAVHNDSNAY